MSLCWLSLDGLLGRVMVVEKLLGPLRPVQAEVVPGQEPVQANDKDF